MPVFGHVFPPVSLAISNSRVKSNNYEIMDNRRRSVYREGEGKKCNWIFQRSSKEGKNVFLLVFRFVV